MNQNATLKLNDVFWTFQGEGRNAGRRALFVRMPECNLSCSWCDTEFDNFEEISEEKLKEFAESEEARFAVLTGGEPLMNKQLPRVIEILKDIGFEIAVETNGTYPYIDGIDWVTCSPKRDAAFKINRHLKDSVAEYKYVVDKDFDFGILLRHDPYDGVHLYLSPEFSNFEESLETIKAYIRQNPDWRISLQTHKWMDIK